MNKNIEEHNKKYQIGEIIQGAKIIKILKYSKNGKSINFYGNVNAETLLNATQIGQIKNYAPIVCLRNALKAKNLILRTTNTKKEKLAFIVYAMKIISTSEKL